MSETTLKKGFTSRLPQVGTTIFSVMSALANAHDAINLGQGFPDFDCDPALIACVDEAMRAGHNQYPLMSGVHELRAAIAQKIAALYGHAYDANDEITVTAGATQGIFTAVLSCIVPGDEVIVIEPAYDSYIPAITLAGGKAVPVQMVLQRDAAGQATGYVLPFEAIERALGPRTRLLILNTPHNPTGTVWTASDMQRLEALLSRTRTLVCSDEVYEHIVLGGARHESVARYPGLAERSFVVSSFGKSFHVTGWKVGYVAAPAWLMAEFRKVHQYNVFTVNAPMQHGIARYMQDASHYTGLPEFYRKKRDYFRTGLSQTRLRLLPCEGAYFQSVDYSGLEVAEAKLDEKAFAQWLTRDVGVAAIPLSAFYSTPTDNHVIRFCFAKKEETLASALERLMRL